MSGKKLNLRRTLLKKTNPALEEKPKVKVETPQEIDRKSDLLQSQARSKRTKKLTVEVDFELHKRLKTFSVDQEIHIRLYISDLISQDLEARGF